MLNYLSHFKKITFGLLALSPGLAIATVVVITNPDLPVTSLSTQEINRIYLGKTKFLRNGTKVIPVDQRIGSSSRERFYAKVIKKSDTEIKSYWSRVIFTGQGYPPVQERDDRSVKELVSKNPNTIGYVNKSVVDGSVKVVYTVP